MKANIHIFTSLLLIALFFTSCQPADNRAEDDRLLARVYNRSLYLSDMDGMLPIGISSEDSSLIIDKFVRTWVRESAMLHEAENNVPEELDINQLVENYRASLIKHNYENIVVERLLDSMITKVEMESFYEKNKEQYQLESPIMRCRFVKAPLDAPQLSQAERWWLGNSASDKKSLENWCMANSSIHHLQDSMWFKVVDIGAYMPQGWLTVDNINNKKRFNQKNSEFIYLFEMLELIPKKEMPPIAYVEQQIKKVILHKRKTQLLEELKDKLYDEALRNNGVSIYQ